MHIEFRDQLPLHGIYLRHVLSTFSIFCSTVLTTRFRVNAADPSSSALADEAASGSQPVGHNPIGGLNDPFGGIV